MRLLTERVSVTRKHRTVLQDISLEFHSGLTYILGLNGSGKSTFLHCLLRTIPFHGEILLDSQNIRNFSRLELARKVAFVPQLLSAPGFMTVQDFILMGRYPYLDSWGSYQRLDLQLVAQQLEHLGIIELSPRRVSQLSGGELQRVKLARALCQETPILLLDEPDQSLDPKAKEELAVLLSQLASDGKMVICVTHEIAPVLDAGVRVLGLRAGKLVLDSEEQLTKEELMQTVYQ